MPNHSDAEEKLVKPSTHFDKPQKVVCDDTLSLDQKSEVLDTMEQDARQMALAEAEGMGGGEPNKLNDVMEAKTELSVVTAMESYTAVMEDLRAWRIEEKNHDVIAHINQAISAIERLIPHVKSEGPRRL